MGNIEEDKERYAALAAAAKERNTPSKPRAWFAPVGTSAPTAPTLANWERELLEVEPMGYDLGRDPSLRPPSQGTELCVCGCGLPVGAGGVSATMRPTPTTNMRPGIAAQPGVDRYSPGGPAIDLPATSNSVAWADLIRSSARTREETSNLTNSLYRQIELRYAYDTRGPIPRPAPGLAEDLDNF